MVEPAILVIARQSPKLSQTRAPIRTVMAESGYEDVAIRGLRRGTLGGDLHQAGWEIYDLSADDISPESWVPLPRRVALFFQKIKEDGIPLVSELFEVRQGVQTGNNNVFILSEDEADRYSADPGFDRFFRLTANEIRAAPSLRIIIYFIHMNRLVH